MDDIWSGMGNFAYLAAVFVPMVVALATKDSYPAWAKFLTAIGLCIIIGAVTVWQTTGSWEWSWAFMLSILGASEAAYRALKALFPSLFEKLASSWNKDPQ